ncbi:MAG: hypothetical protein ACKOA8_18550, partial [Deltaproteobacteria bacterium]
CSFVKVMLWMSSILKKKFSVSQLKWPLLLLFVFEVVAVVSWSSYKPKIYAHKGFVVKNGKSYIVFWIDDERKQASTVLNSLKAAVDFAHDELQLEVVGAPLNYHPIESIWARNNINGFAIYWKTFSSQWINRLTFNSIEEANSFESYLKMGAYSPSPIGHSLALLPIKKN